jgi:hypothetical protein
MTSGKRRPYHRLNVDFVNAVRSRRDADWPTVNSMTDLRRMPWHGCEQILRDSVLIRQNSASARRLQRLAADIGYEGPILGAVFDGTQVPQ